MSNRTELARHSENHAVPALPLSYKLIAATVAAVTVVTGVLVLNGRLDSTYGIAIPAAACLAGFLGALAPRALLTWLFASAPLLWALGDASLFRGERAHVNLPMLVGFVVVLGFCHVLLVKDSDPAIELIRKLVLGMGLACFPAIFSAQDFFTGAGAYLRIMCPYILMFGTLRHVRDKTDVLRFARSMAFAHVALAIVFVIAYWRSEVWVDLGGYTRLSPIYFQAQAFGMYLSIMVFVVMLNFLLTRNKGYLLLLFFPLVALFLTYVRTAWVGGIVLIVLLTFQIKKSYGRRLLLVGSLLAAIFFSVVWQSVLRYDTAVDSTEVADKVFSGRLGVDAIAIERYLDAPPTNKIFGIGFFRAKEATGLVLGEEFMIHDDYLALLIEAGVFAFAIYLAILVALLRRSRQGKRLARNRGSYDLCGAAFVLIIAVMIMGIPGAFYTQVLSNFYIYGIMGLMLSQSSLVNRWHHNNEEAGSDAVNV